VEQGLGTYSGQLDEIRVAGGGLLLRGLVAQAVLGVERPVEYDLVPFAIYGFGVLPLRLVLHSVARVVVVVQGEVARLLVFSQQEERQPAVEPPAVGRGGCRHSRLLRESVWLLPPFALFPKVLSSDPHHQAPDALLEAFPWPSLLQSQPRHDVVLRCCQRAGNCRSSPLLLGR